MKRCFLTLPTGLFYRLISRQPPFCTFDDACNFFLNYVKSLEKYLISVGCTYQD